MNEGEIVMTAETPETAKHSAGSLERMVRPMDCYVGIKPCGCMVAWVYDSKKHPKDVAKAVAQFIKDGYRVESANTDDIRSKLGPCRCNRPNAADQRPGHTERPDCK